MNISFQKHGDAKLKFLHYNVIHKSVLLLNFIFNILICIKS